MPERICSVDGCAGAHRARDLCSTHYNQRHQPDQHKKVSAECGWCGRACEKEAAASRGYAARFCSPACRSTWRQRDKLPVLFAGMVARPVRTAVEKRGTKRWVAGSCVRCAMPYVTEDYTDKARYCSVRCAKRVSKQRYRARKIDAYVADVSPARIYERDGWRCKLCRKKVRRDKVVPHPLAAVLDHVVPLADGGTHEPANVQCAHFICNSLKSHRGGYEQLALIG